MELLKIIKIGGNVVDNQDMLKVFLNDFSNIKTPKLLVHGGGKLVSALADKMGVPVTMVDGRRITDTATLDLATMVYGGKINKQLVANCRP